jgi:hypothetical protein
MAAPSDRSTLLCPRTCGPKRGWVRGSKGVHGHRCKHATLVDQADFKLYLRLGQENRACPLT